MTRGNRRIVQGEDIRGAPKRPAHRRITMKKHVWKYGLLSGLVLALTMAVTVPFEHHIQASYGMVVGYTTMVLSFLIVFVGVKRHRRIHLRRRRPPPRSPIRRPRRGRPRRRHRTAALRALHHRTHPPRHPRTRRRPADAAALQRILGRPLPQAHRRTPRHSASTRRRRTAAGRVSRSDLAA
jgi:hypothetical protein